MRRSLLAVAVCLVASSAIGQTLNLPAVPDRFAVATITGGGPTVELELPADYPTAGDPYFGTSGDLDSGLALIGSPEAWWDGVAFIFDASTGDPLHTLLPGEDLDGGVGRPRFGTAVDLADGYAAVVAPQAGSGSAFGQGPGATVIFDATAGVKLGSIWGELPGWYISDAEIGGGSIALTYTNYGDGAVQSLSYSLPALVPEPSGMLLVIMGLASMGRRR